MVVQGSASAAGTSVAIPAHQPGDLIFVAARGTTAAPSIPGAGGTVPSWGNISSAIANSMGLTTVYAVATASNHTTGTFTSADQIIVVVLRPDSGKQLALGASAVGNGSNTQTIIYPALTFQKTDGTAILRVGTRTVADSEVANVPAAETFVIGQPAAASMLMAVFHRQGIVASSITSATVNTTGTNAAYRAQTIEIKETIPPQSVSLAGKGVTSGQSFGTARAYTGYAREVYLDAPVAYWRLGDAGATAKDEVGLNPGTYVGTVTHPAAAMRGDPDASVTLGTGCYVTLPASTPALTGPLTFEAWVKVNPADTGFQYLYNGYYIGAGYTGWGVGYQGVAAGDKKIAFWSSGGAGWVGSTGTITDTGWHHVAVTLSGTTVTFYIDGQPAGTATTTAVGSWTGQKALGSDYTAGGAWLVAMDEAALYDKALSATRIQAHFLAGWPPVPVGGVGSAQAFGAVKTAVTVAVGGVYPTGYVPTITGQRVTGRSDAITGGYRTGVFGPVTASQQFNQTKPVGGVLSAQAFSSTTAKAFIVVLVGGVPTFGTFGAVTPKTAITRAVAGLGSAQAFGPVLVQSGGKIGVFGLGSAQAFGTPVLKSGGITVLVPGVVSAQAFGAIGLRRGVLVGGVTSAQAFGLVNAIYRAPVGGVVTAQQFGVPTTLIAFRVSGLSSAQVFAAVKVVFAVRLTTGIPSAQAFGLVTLKPGRVTIPIVGLASEQAFGSALVGGLDVFNVWLDEIVCTDLDVEPVFDRELPLAPDTERTIDLDPLVCK